MSGEAPILFAFREASLGYGRKPVLRDVSLTIRGGEYWCVIGANASGKTTLVRTLIGDLDVIAGKLLVDDERASPRRIGFVPQHMSLNPTLPTTVREFVSLGFVGLGLARAERAANLAWALDRVGLAGRERVACSHLSGGQRQRALLARALVRRPAVLILDEPTQALDKLAERHILDTIAGLNAVDGVTVIFVTHHIAIASRHATRIASVGGGAVVSGAVGPMLAPDQLARTFGAPAAHFAAEGAP